MELGGNAPLLVLEDANIDVAVEGTMLAKMRNLGEACTAANRIYVHKNVADEFTTKLTQAMGNLKVGNGLDPDVNVGPLVNASTRDKVSEFVADAISKGAKLHVGGKVPCGKGYFYPPTVLSNVPKLPIVFMMKYLAQLQPFRLLTIWMLLLRVQMIRNMDWLLMFLQKI